MILLEWCILNNPGVKQDIFQDKADEGDQFSTQSDIDNYGSKTAISANELNSAKAIDDKYGTNTYAIKKAQANSTKGMKQNDLLKGSDWVNPRIANEYIKLRIDRPVSAKKLLKYAWLQGKLDNSGVSYPNNKQDNNKLSLAEYIKNLTLDKLQKYTHTTYSQEELNKIKSYIGKNDKNVDVEKFTSVKNRNKIDKKILDALIAFPPWKKEFDLAYTRIVLKLNNLFRDNYITLYRGLHLKDSNVLYNSKIFKDPKILYSVLQNDYNSATTDITRAMKFALDPKTKKLDQYSVIVEFKVNHDMLNIPFTMYLNGKNGRYSESEINTLKDDDELQNVKDINAYIGLQAINKKFEQNVIDNMSSKVIMAKDKANQSDVYVLNFMDEKNIIKHLEKATNTPFEIFKIIDRRENIKDISGNFKNEYYSLILAKDKNNKLHLFLFDRFVNELSDCQIINSSELANKFGELKLQYTHRDRDDKDLYEIIGPGVGRKANTEVLIAQTIIDYNYSYLQREIAGEQYQKNITNAVMKMLKSDITNDDAIAIKSRLKDLFNIDDKTFNKWYNSAKTQIYWQKLHDLIEGFIAYCIEQFQSLNISRFLYEDEFDSNSLSQFNTSLSKIYNNIINSYRYEEEEKIDTSKINEVDKVYNVIEQIFAVLKGYDTPENIKNISPISIKTSFDAINHRNNSNIKSKLVSILFDNVTPYTPKMVTNPMQMAMEQRRLDNYNKQINDEILRISKEINEIKTHPNAVDDYAEYLSDYIEKVNKNYKKYISTLDIPENPKITKFKEVWAQIREKKKELDRQIKNL